MLPAEASRPLDQAAAALRRHPALHRLRFGAGAGLLVPAVIAGGALGVLLGLLALLLIADALIPDPHRSPGAADERFHRLARERARAQRLRRLTGRAPEALQVVDDRASSMLVAERRDLGLQPIPVASITGTVEPTKARLFDRRFRPAPAARERWKRIWTAEAHGVALPPISVYRVEDEHVVRDGHHRVSVALDQGRTTIDAEVIELRRRRR